MVALAIIGYILSVAVYLVILHKTNRFTDHDSDGMEALMWPVVLLVLILLVFLSLPGYLSKVIQKLVK